LQQNTTQLGCDDGDDDGKVVMIIMNMVITTMTIVILIAVMAVMGRGKEEHPKTTQLRGAYTLGKGQDKRARVKGQDDEGV
jgi:flagellar basal body-associated protein FliL